MPVRLEFVLDEVYLPLPGHIDPLGGWCRYACTLERHFLSSALTPTGPQRAIKSIGHITILAGDRSQRAGILRRQMHRSNDPTTTPWASLAQSKDPLKARGNRLQ